MVFVGKGCVDDFDVVMFVVGGCVGVFGVFGIVVFYDEVGGLKCFV